jgi:hypothetical protein
MTLTPAGQIQAKVGHPLRSLEECSPGDNALLRQTLANMLMAHPSLMFLTRKCQTKRFHKV